MKKNKWILFFLSFLSACGFYREKPATPDVTNAINNINQSHSLVSYSQVGQYVFSSCVGCHSSASASGGVALDSYLGVKANLSNVANAALTQKTMPPSASLAQDQQDLLQKWIDQGAPEYGSSGTPTPTPSGPTPSPSPISASVSYANNVAPIIQANCLGCHNGGQSPNLSGFTNFSNNASSSISAIDSGSMPRNSSPLSTADKSTIQTWINEGRPNN